MNALVEALGFRHISVVHEEYAVDRTGAKMFGVMELDQGMHGARFALGIRNAHDKSFRLAVTVGYRVFVCENLAFSGDFSPIRAKHTKNFSLNAALSVGVDDMQRNFKPMVESVERWQGQQLTDVAARLVIYRAFIEGDLEVPRHLDRRVHDLYFKPQHDDFAFAHDVEPLQRLHVGLQGTGAHSAVPGNGEARHIPGRCMTLKFPPGQFVATPGALRELAQADESPLTFLRRHLAGDWGDLDVEDRQENELSLVHGFRHLSAYVLQNGTRLWIITEADRSATTLLLPEDY